MRWHIAWLAVAASSTLSLAHAQAPAGEFPVRPPVLFQEDWKQSAKGGEHPLTADSVGNAALELKQYCPSGQLLLTGKEGDDSNPVHVWTGACTTPCAVAFRDKGHLADLSGLSRIRWTIKTSGFHQVRPIVKLADGTWLVADRAEGRPGDWLVSEVSYADLRWVKLDIARVVTVGTFLDKVDLTKVDEIGFADLMPGSGHGPGGWVDVAQIEVFGKPVARTEKKEAR